MCGSTNLQSKTIVMEDEQEGAIWIANSKGPVGIFFLSRTLVAFVQSDDPITCVHFHTEVHVLGVEA